MIPLIDVQITDAALIDVAVDETTELIDVQIADAVLMDVEWDTAVLVLQTAGDDEGILTPLPLPVVQNGQTVWDLGGSEPRHTLWVNGVRYFSDSYSIVNGILTWTGQFSIKTSFKLFLT